MGWVYAFPFWINKEELVCVRLLFLECTQSLLLPFVAAISALAAGISLSG